MSEIRSGARLRALAAMAAVALALFATAAVWGSAHAADATPPATATGCARAADTKGATAGTPEAGSTCVEITMHDLYWGANLVTIPANTDVTFVIRSEAAATHSFDISDHNNTDVTNLKVDLDVDPGKQGTVVVNAPSGTYYFYCDVPGHEQAGMWGILKVEDGAKISAQNVDNPKSA
jgi:uncharacterized cupredoxin-like copper-binding protein